MDLELKREITQKYIERSVPRGNESPPHPYIDVVNALKPGIALDLGCRDGDVCFSLVELGWVCEGLDPIADAVMLARLRANLNGMTDCLTFETVQWLDYAPKRPAYDLVFDIGMMDAHPREMHTTYAQKMRDVLKPDGLAIVYARFDALKATAIDQLTPARLAATLSPHFNFADSISTTATHGTMRWHAAWLLLQRR